MAGDIQIQKGYPPHLNADAARLYFEAFEAKLGTLLGKDGRGVRFIESVLDPSHAISATSSSGETLLGIAGLKTSKGSMVGGGLSDLAAIYGWFGALWRGLPLGLIERDLVDDVLLMDGIAVADGQRGKGIGTKLLGAIIEEAKAQGKSRIRLDVIDSNPKARALYERVGFVKTGEEHLGPFQYLFGFKSATKMEMRL